MARPGALNERITFQEAALTADGGGGSTKAWADLASTPTVWAFPKARSGKEMFDSERETATSFVNFTIRNRSDLNETMRIVWRGVNYNIRDIPAASPQDMYLTIVAEGGVSN